VIDGTSLVVLGCIYVGVMLQHVVL